MVMGGPIYSVSDFNPVAGRLDRERNAELGSHWASAKLVPSIGHANNAARGNWEVHEVLEAMAQAEGIAVGGWVFRELREDTKRYRGTLLYRPTIRAFGIRAPPSTTWTAFCRKVAVASWRKPLTPCCKTSEHIPSMFSAEAFYHCPGGGRAGEGDISEQKARGRAAIPRRRAKSAVGAHAQRGMTNKWKLIQQSSMSGMNKSNA